MIENTRRRLLYQLNSRWIYGKIVSSHDLTALGIILIPLLE